MKLRIFNKRIAELDRAPGGSEGGVPGQKGGAQQYSDVGTPATDRGIPVAAFPGFRGSSPHAIVESLPGAQSYQFDDSPITFARYNMSRGMHDVQLSNGWQSTNYGRRTIYASSGYLNEVQPQIPGQSRLIGMGGSPANFVPRGPAPSQWQNIVDKVQSQPANPGGPGQALGPVGFQGARG